MNKVVVIQARTGSTRLPRKVMRPLAGKTLLERMVERVMAAETPFSVVIATTTGRDDDCIRELCARNGLTCFSGHPTDLLDRHYQAARSAGADVVLKIPSDCPLIDPQVIDRVLGAYLKHPPSYDFVSNLHPATYPDGNDVEVIPMPILEIAWKEARKSFEREHTTPFIWERPERFRLHNVRWETGLDYSMTHRFTIDYEEDYLFVKTVYDALCSPDRPIFSLNDILTLLKSRPDIAALNSRYAGVNWYRHHIHELRTISPDSTRT